MTAPHETHPIAGRLTDPELDATPCASRTLHRGTHRRRRQLVAPAPPPLPPLGLTRVSISPTRRGPRDRFADSELDAVLAGAESCANAAWRLGVTPRAVQKRIKRIGSRGSIGPEGTCELVRGPVGRYYGGKWRDAPWIISHFPVVAGGIDIYTEAFCGFASVLLRKPRHQTEILNDADGDVVNLFRVLQHPRLSRALEGWLRRTPFSRAEYERACEYSGGDRLTRAWALIVRSYMGFGSDSSSGGQSGFRTGVRKRSEVRATGSKAPVGHEWARYPERLVAFRDRLAGVHLEAAPAVEILRRYDSPNTLHYVDPPYLPTTRSARSHRKGKGYKHELTLADHRDLAEVLHSLRGAVVLSGYESDLYGEMYRDWRSFRKAAYADHGQLRTEVLWIKPATPAEASTSREVAHG